MRAYILDPTHPAGRFCRTLRIEGREPRMVVFNVGGSVTLDPQEVDCLADEIAAGFIAPAGTKFEPKPKAELPRLDAQEDPRDENFNPVDLTEDWHTPLAWAKGWLVGRFGRGR